MRPWRYPPLSALPQWQVQVQESGEGVATGRGVGPWTVGSRRTPL